eukprot:COSAG02_NODE_16362_length_1090_cov_0.790111_1_plen_59_part_00
MTCEFRLADSYVAVLCADSVYDVFQDRTDLKKFYAWTDNRRPDVPAEEQLDGGDGAEY